MSDLASHHLIAIRDVVKLSLKTGLALAPADTVKFVKRLNTVIELSKNQEEQQRIDSLALLAAQSWMKAQQHYECGPYAPDRPTAVILSFPDAAGDSVVAFPGRPSGGGRA